MEGAPYDDMYFIPLVQAIVSGDDGHLRHLLSTSEAEGVYQQCLEDLLVPLEQAPEDVPVDAETAYDDNNSVDDDYGSSNGPITPTRACAGGRKRRLRVYEGSIDDNCLHVSCSDLPWSTLFQTV
jgi:hypothetical protein